jgi:hypothetical protein
LSLLGNPDIVPGSGRRLGDGSFQFRLKAVGVSQASIDVSTSLAGWQYLQTVGLVGGYGSVTDPAAAGHPRGVYRVSIP